MIYGEVDPTDPRTLYEALGDPREFEGFDQRKLKDGDYAVIVNARPGAIYFMRTGDGHEPKTVFDGDVIMTHLLLCENATHGEARLRRFVGEKYRLEIRQGRDMDGITVPFYVLKNLDKERGCD